MRGAKQQMWLTTPQALLRAIATHGPTDGRSMRKPWDRRTVSRRRDVTRPRNRRQAAQRRDTNVVSMRCCCNRKDGIGSNDRVLPDAQVSSGGSILTVRAEDLGLEGLHRALNRDDPLDRARAVGETQ